MINNSLSKIYYIFLYFPYYIISTVLSSFVDYEDDDVLILTIKCNRKTSNTITTTLCSAVNIKKQIILKKSNFIEKQKDDFSKITPTQQEKQFSSNKKAIKNKRK